MKLTATGSASFDLSNKIGEPLVGRKWTKILYPVSQFELKKDLSHYELEMSLEKRLIYGAYPEILTSESDNDKQKILGEISSSYLLKDILALEQIKSSSILIDLLKMIAFQIGSEVSLTELGTQLGIDRKTVARYLDLLEKTFILYKLQGYSRNLRKEITKKSKYYFVDNGIRNAIINNYNDLTTRNDIGQLWENFLISERIKRQTYLSGSTSYWNNYFWRTWDQKKVDWVEMRDGKLYGFEFKWTKSDSKNKKFWLEAYPNEAEFQLINKDNYLEFIT